MPLKASDNVYSVREWFPAEAAFTAGDYQGMGASMLDFWSANLLPALREEPAFYLAAAALALWAVLDLRAFRAGRGSK